MEAINEELELAGKQELGGTTSAQPLMGKATAKVNSGRDPTDVGSDQRLRDDLTVRKLSAWTIELKNCMDREKLTE